ncbi:MAG: hypothetical protein P8Y70_16995 [Candidatus Lokiarchaeota archaeon]
MFENQNDEEIGNERKDERKNLEEKSHDRSESTNFNQKEPNNKEEGNSIGDFGSSISNLVDNIMKSTGKIFTKISESEDIIGDLERFGEYIEKSEKGFENMKEIKALKKLGKKLEKMGKLEKLGSILGGEFGRKVNEIFSTEKTKQESKEPSDKINKMDQEKSDIDWINQKKEQFKKIIEERNHISIEEISQILEISEDQAEILIYELVGEGIVGKLEEGVFKFTDNREKVLFNFYKFIEKSKIKNGGKKDEL